jgi:oxygen-independent coproporphyrinogen-3 oxidase
MSKYFESLEREIDLYADVLQGKRVKTLYFGGGTPSHVPVKYVERIIEKLATHLFLDVEEATFEFNPEDVNRQLVKELFEIGINRASVGLQTSSNEILKVLGRPYSFEEFEKSYSILRESFENVNVDLMYSLPYERIEDVRRDLKVIEKLKPSHVSYYELEIHEEVPLFSMIKTGQVRLPSEDESEMMYDLIVKEMEKMGYKRYEISSWTKDKACLHNLAYWKNEDYVGFGLSSGSHFSRKRWVNTPEINDYILKVKAGKKPTVYESANNNFDEACETLFMGLRLSEGVDIERMKKEFGDDFENAFSKIKKFCGEILECSSRLKLTKLGMKFSAMVLRELA